MTQEKGYIVLSRTGNENYIEDLKRIKDNKLFTIIKANYRVYIYNKPSNYSIRGNLSIGKLNLNVYLYNESEDKYYYTEHINQLYKAEGINAIKPLTYTGAESKNSAVSYDIIAECPTVPYISNIDVKVKDNRSPISVSWKSENQDIFTINATVKEKIKYTFTGSIEKNHTIPNNIFDVGEDIKISIKVEYTLNNNLNKNAYALEEKNITIENLNPIISEITTTEINIDNSKKIIWKSNRQDTYKLELNGAVYTGLKDKECLISIEHLHFGQNNAKLTLTNTINSITKSVEKEFSFTVAADNPTITALDPNNIDVNIDKPVVITWNTVPAQSKFVLKANDTTYTGTTIMGITVPVGVFHTNTNTISVTATRHILGQTLTGSKTVTFNGYGKPTAPIFDEKSIYNMALPVFHWTSKEQTAYQVQVVEDNNNVVVDSSEVVSTDNFYKVSKSLKNKTKYTVKSRIRSKFGLWSDYAQKEITTSFDVIAPATLALFEDIDGGIIINTSNQDNAKFAKSEVWRKDDFSDWKRIGYNLPFVSSFKDNTIASGINYYYKAITFTQSGGASESEIKTYSMNIDRSFFVDIESNKSIYLGYSFSEIQDIKIKRIQDRKTVLYQGKSAPDIEIGERDYKQISVNLAFKTYQEFKTFEYFIDKSKVLMFKDKIGRKIYCCVSSWGDEESNTFGFVGITLNLVEVNFIEKDIFDGGRKLRLIKLDEGWKLDTGLTVDMMIYE